MRKCEIAVGVVDLLIPLWILLSFVTWTVRQAMSIGIVGRADGPTAIYVAAKTSSVFIAVSLLILLALSGVLLLTAPRLKAVVILPVLLGFIHVVFISYIWWSSILAFVSFACIFLLGFANMSLLFRRGVRQWWKKKDSLSSIEA